MHRFAECSEPLSYIIMLKEIIGTVENRLLKPLAAVGSSNDPIHIRERPGGMLNFYYREVA